MSKRPFGTTVISYAIIYLVPYVVTCIKRPRLNIKYFYFAFGDEHSLIEIRYCRVPARWGL